MLSDTKYKADNLAEARRVLQLNWKGQQGKATGLQSLRCQRSLKLYQRDFNRDRRAHSSLPDSEQSCNCETMMRAGVLASLEKLVSLGRRNCPMR